MRYCFCVAGWHFRKDFYDALLSIPAERFIISHRPPAEIAEMELYRSIAQDLYFLPNRGLDFGAYHQFNALFDTTGYEFVVYCHDDVVIKDARFVGELQERFQDVGVAVVGNGYNGSDAEFAFGKYRDRMWWRDEDETIVRTVRGSFFAARVVAIERIGNFPVDWRASAARMRRGNNSLRNFAHLICSTFGRQSIDYLEAHSWLETDYLIELRRGERVAAGGQKS
jgi:hypothetical protein